ncbi:uncharacterized protein LOC110455033 [Mizuhopecten yessoensis]|uniref:SYGAGamide n=1 Tax=Mizuhopecten yessoensis TaxID=6573 RepID=A0A210QE07_MIZYE|nr:uncharacterized protein LOC110455033 [Mizuhopecten yessoensis]AXN93529.1 SYGAGamide [Mizuhopecten yessoensis]OWF46956.1 hypothetical protein KP79_PYT14910 [Mizuhopecten yessoensis]
MQPNIYVCSYVAVVVVILSTIAHCYPSKQIDLFTDSLPDDSYFFEDRSDRRASLAAPVLSLSSRTYHPLQQLIKRGYQNKRYSLNDLIARLRAMVGSDEIRHSGRSSYLRFGAGGKR